MKSTYLENDNIYLRAVEPLDLDVVYEMENHPDLWEVSSFTVPYSRYLLKEYITQSSNDIYVDKQLRLMIVRKEDNRTLGIIDVTDFVPLHGRGSVGVAIHEQYREKGYATDALSLLCEYAFNYLHLKQLYVHIPADNHASIRLFSSCGFLQTGLLKEWLHVNGGYKDVVFMQRIMG
ncbi:GNAT family N-acetyltransferase [Bacteroides sp. OttesenSCG-928-D19]|nr:GNAT family N-acetyltransferase [Bacteroides sp. OttesenSCG-928-N06]MDL2304878.1 GNAT family N-acetyltransferase [Bacteroides sp. OttesenSCG-928-D19]